MRCRYARPPLARDCAVLVSWSTGSITYSPSASRDALTRAATCRLSHVAVVVETAWYTHGVVLLSNFAVAYWNACANVSSPKFTWVWVTVVTVWNWRRVVCGRLGRFIRDNIFQDYYLKLNSWCPLSHSTCRRLDDCLYLSLIHIWRCRRSTLCRSRWSPYH